MGQVTVAFKQPQYTVQVRVAQDATAKPAVDQVDPTGDKQPGQPDSASSSSIIKKEEIHKIIDDKSKMVEKLSVEETNDGKQKVVIMVAPAPILRQPGVVPPGQNPASAPAPATAAPAPAKSVMPSNPQPAAAMASSKKNTKLVASRLPDAFMKAMGY